VTVVDDSAPIINDCPNDISISANASCEATVNWTAPTATDNCSATISGDHAPGSTFPIGTTTVTYTATDEAGNTSLCSFTVTVTDEVRPQISNCPAAKIVKSSGSSCGANVTWELPSAIDNCSSVLTTSASHSSGDFFSAGTVTNVIYTFSDDWGNTATCSFNVIVQYNEAPVVTNCPENLSILSDGSGAVSVNWDPPKVESTCGEVVLSSNYEPGARFNVGTTTIEYKLANNNAEPLCTFDVIVVANEDPVIQIPDVITPDGDGINDEWVITNIEKFGNNKVVVVDRWGSVVFEAHGYDNASVIWRGENTGGSMVPTGTYFFYVEYVAGDAPISKTGFIELIK